jgi:hypothetical protein
MPAPGRKPKPEDQRRNQNKPMIDWTVVSDVPYRGKKPSLPSKLRHISSGAMFEVPLPSLTRAWWKRVSAMPHCSLWTETDWQFALDTAMVHAAFTLGDTVRAAELRVREKQMGTTFDSRRDLRIRYVPVAEVEEPNKPITLADRRKELQG